MPFFFITEMDPRIAELHSRLKVASDLRTASLLSSVHDVKETSQECKSEHPDPKKHAVNSETTRGPSLEELQLFCKEITPQYSYTNLECSADHVPRISQRDLERSVQGQQIANNRQRRYARKMKTFSNPITRVEVSDHELSKQNDAHDTWVRQNFNLFQSLFSVPIRKYLYYRTPGQKVRLYSIVIRKVDNLMKWMPYPSLAITYSLMWR